MKYAPTLLAFFAFAALLPAFAQGPAAPTPRLDTRLGGTPSRVVPVDRIVAVVNDEVITQNDLHERVALVVSQIQRQGGQLPSVDVLNRQILERMHVPKWFELRTAMEATPCFFARAIASRVANSAVTCPTPSPASITATAPESFTKRGSVTGLMTPERRRA